MDEEQRRRGWSRALRRVQLDQQLGRGGRRDRRVVTLLRQRRDTPRHLLLGHGNRLAGLPPEGGSEGLCHGGDRGAYAFFVDVSVGSEAVVERRDQLLGGVDDAIDDERREGFILCSAKPSGVSSGEGEPIIRCRSLAASEAHAGEVEQNSGRSAGSVEERLPHACNWRQLADYVVGGAAVEHRRQPPLLCCSATLRRGEGEGVHGREPTHCARDVWSRVAEEGLAVTAVALHPNDRAVLLVAEGICQGGEGDCLEGNSARRSLDHGLL
mmetsp:Transcript_11641/g.47044  ORF Transcript_11641/g.47044 Transcript_11641/m.47044 type:complete len:269 (+) Transcript_11641:993-1799(+)